MKVKVNIPSYKYEKCFFNYDKLNKFIGYILNNMDLKSIGDIYSGNHKQKCLCYEDAHCVALDVELNRKADIHFLIIPKRIAKLSSASYEEEQLLGHLLLIAKNVAVNKGLLETGYSIIVDEDYVTSRLKCLHVFGSPYIGTVRPMGNKSRL